MLVIYMNTVWLCNAFVFHLKCFRLILNPFIKNPATSFKHYLVTSLFINKVSLSNVLNVELCVKHVDKFALKINEIIKREFLSSMDTQALGNI